MNRTLWYRQPAADWDQALPLGNGRLGAMVFGSVDAERLQLNEDSLWYGSPKNRVNPDAQAHLAEVRDLLSTGRIRAAEDLALATLAGVPEHPAHYVPVGNLDILFGGSPGLGRLANPIIPNTIEAYRRELNLSKGVARVEYQRDGAAYHREAFVSAPDQVVALRLACTTPGRLSFLLHLTRGRYSGRIHHPDDRTLVMESDGGGEGSVRFAAAVRVLAQGGRVTAQGEWLRVDEADHVLILAAAQTTFRSPDPADACLVQVEAAGRRTWADLKARHEAEHRSWFDRLDLGLVPHSPGRTALEALPTDERLARVIAGASDPGLVELYTQYGRYLLAASSRPGTLPANLQGLWNDQFLPPWGSKYTININTQMNYWPAERANLSECHTVLLDHLERMLPRGREVAKTMYGCRGFVAHHNTDLWGDCAPVDRWIPGTLWPMGAAWLCLHLWEHYEYTLDRAFLDRAYPLMREAALFHLDFLTVSPEGQLVTNPSVSPENTYILPSGERGCLCYGPAMDSQILHALFTACQQASHILNTDHPLAVQFCDARDRLPPPSIGRHGQLMEWPVDYEEAEPGHRHISHLFALYPGQQITRLHTSELAQACRTTLERRLAQGGGHTGWSKAWIINLWARLGDGNQAWSHFEGLLRHSTLPNLFDNHPPFQIDGNFGATAGLFEMLIQDLHGVIHLLPALPDALPAGWVRGLRAKGGFEIDVKWKAGRLEEAVVISLAGRPCRLAYREPLSMGDEFATEKGATYRVTVKTGRS